MNSFLNNQIATLQKMAQAIKGKKLEGWTVTHAYVTVDRSFWTKVELVAEATNGKEGHKFFYTLGRPVNQLAKWALEFVA